MSKNDGGPAFPFVAKAKQPTIEGEADSTIIHYGMSLRDYFAAAALQGIIALDADQLLRQAKMKKAKSLGISPNTIDAAMAWKSADAMLAEREK